MRRAIRGLSSRATWPGCGTRPSRFWMTCEKRPALSEFFSSWFEFRAKPPPSPCTVTLWSRATVAVVALFEASLFFVTAYGTPQLRSYPTYFFFLIRLCFFLLFATGNTGIVSDLPSGYGFTPPPPTLFRPGSMISLIFPRGNRFFRKKKESPPLPGFTPGVYILPEMPPGVEGFRVRCPLPKDFRVDTEHFCRSTLSHFAPIRTFLPGVAQSVKL